MTTIDNIIEAIKQCGKVKVRLEALRDMIDPKPGPEPVLRIESITRPDTWWEPRSEADLADCPEGTVIEVSGGWVYYRLGPAREADWVSDSGREYINCLLWEMLIRDARDHITFSYSGNF